VAARGNENAYAPGNVDLIAGDGSGGVTGAISISPYAYIGERPANNLGWHMAIGPRFAMYDENASGNIMNNFYRGVDGKYYRREALGAAWLQLAYDGSIILFGAPLAAAGSEITSASWNRYFTATSDNVKLYGGSSFNSSRATLQRQNLGSAVNITITSETTQTIDLSSSAYAGKSRFILQPGAITDCDVYFTGAVTGDEIYLEVGGTSDYQIAVAWRIDPSDGTWMRYAGRRWLHLICTGTAPYSTANTWSIYGVHGLLNP
jgi:hypothetical protein